MAPSVFLIRHGRLDIQARDIISSLLTTEPVSKAGQTEWSKVGKYTGITEIELTDTGKKEAIALGDSFVGPNKLIDLSRLVHIFVSPRMRARETFELVTEKHPELMQRATFTEDLREWDHGDYEGLTTEQIKNLRAEKGLDPSSKWSI